MRKGAEATNTEADACEEKHVLGPAAAIETCQRVEDRTAVEVSVEGCDQVGVASERVKENKESTAQTGMGFLDSGVALL